MYRVSDMIGKSVLSTTSGAKLGTVSDALLDTEAVRVVGLVVRHGLIPKEHVLPLSDVQTVGRDAVLARTDEHMMSSRQWRDGDVSATRSSSVQGRRVVTAGGEKVGEVSDILVDEETGDFTGLEIESHSLAGLRTRRTVLPPDAAPRIGPDAVIVRDGVLTAVEGRDDERVADTNAPHSTDHDRTDHTDRTDRTDRTGGVR